MLDVGKQASSLAYSFGKVVLFYFTNVIISNGMKSKQIIHVSFSGVWPVNYMGPIIKSFPVSVVVLAHALMASTLPQQGTNTHPSSVTQNSHTSCAGGATWAFSVAAI